MGTSIAQLHTIAGNEELLVGMQVLATLARFASFPIIAIEDKIYQGQS